jgi:uncharacterized protein YbbK (DUF523 family)
MDQSKVLLSACLAGVNCVYDGTNKLHPVFAGIYKKGDAVLFCPEALGGMKVPHSPSEISGGDGLDVIEGRGSVFSKDGKEVTVYFVKGARKTLELAVKKGIKKAVMKSKSPSCGCGRIFDGTFTKKLVSGYGVTAALLKQNGIVVVSDVEYLESVKCKVKSAKREVGERKV